ncbi:MAG: hypothetical protein HY609_00765, partial [Deltaproteobacteria bacterium]|nr:hypothetical protein [Deltaproteobacteria bacterium]
EQAKLKESNQKFETKNVDGSSIDQDLTVTYAYDKNGKIRGASGSGTYEKNDGFGNITTGKIEQKYQMVAGNIQPAGGRGRRFIEDPQSINKLPGPPALPVITAVSKTTVEPEELVTIYGRNFSIKNEKGRRDHNLKQLLWMQGKWYRAVPVNFGKNRGEEESWEFIAPKNPGSYSFKIEAKGGDVLWDKPLIVVAKKGPPLPVLTGISKVEVEPKEAMVVYGKNLIAQDASGFTSMNFDKMFFVKDKAETRVTAITSGPKRGQDQSINFSAPKTAGSYSIKMIAKSGEVITWNNPMLAVIDRAAEELAKKKALEEEAKKKAEEELARKKALEEELTKKKAEEELALRKKQEEEEAPSSTGQYCNPDVPRYSQPGCIEPPEQEGPPPTQGQPCNPNIPRYQQPGCVE